MAARLLRPLRTLLTGRRCACDTCPFSAPSTRRRVVLFGSPNVGKSVVFNHLTGSYAVVSNYPGTTVEIARGRARLGDVDLDILDSPGAYSLATLSEDEQVSQALLFAEPPDLVLHVVDAKQLGRMLPLTLQLIEAGLTVALDVNIIDEAARAGLTVDADALAEALGVPVVTTAAASGLGVDRLRALLAGPLPPTPAVSIDYPEPIASAVAAISHRLRAAYPISPRALSLLLLQRDRGARDLVRKAEPEAVAEVDRLVAEAESRFPHPLSFPIAVARQQAADRIAAPAIMARHRPAPRSLADALARLTVHPIAGFPLLAAVLYLMYLAVGRLGAGVLVDFLDHRLFRQWLEPPLIAFFQRLLPSTVWSSLFVGDYGLITLALRYSFAIILPLVGIFFLSFAVLEDTGYLPRVALLLDRLFKRIGLSGRAVIPVVLGLGCDTMATLVTRVLATRRERIIATFLLALAIPCSAQLGVILGLLSGHPLGLLIWAGVVSATFLAAGFLAARILPGEAPRFYLEIPPLRLPSLRNVCTKTLARLKWYAAEVVPFFLLASLLVWLAELSRIFPLLLAALKPMVRLIGLPADAADAFLFGFLRRDYGAARLFDIFSSGAMSGASLVVAMVTLTLFIPCLAQFLVMQKERGLRVALAVFAVILPVAFCVGLLLNLVLTGLRVPV